MAECKMRLRYIHVNDDTMRYTHVNDDTIVSFNITLQLGTRS